MYDAIVAVVGRAGSRLKMLLRVRAFYSTAHLIMLYKCHILPFLESGTTAFYHAAPSILNLLDDIQLQFLESISVSKEDALLTHNLAPLRVRRDIMMLGILHRIVLGIGPRPFHDLIKMSNSTLLHHGFRLDRPLHNKQLQDCVTCNSLVILKRSLFGLVTVYNRLDQNVVDSRSVEIFPK